MNVLNWGHTIFLYILACVMAHTHTQSPKVEKIKATQFFQEYSRIFFDFEKVITRSAYTRKNWISSFFIVDEKYKKKTDKCNYRDLEDKW